jgi:serine/threonine protein kinase
MINEHRMSIKIIDFDIAQPITPDLLSMFYGGTPGYGSPEILTHKPYSLEKNQVWQLGIILYRLYFLDIPFNGDEQTLDIGIKMKQNMAMNPKRGFTPDIMEFLTKMLAKDPANRPTIDEVAKFGFY